MAKEFDVIVLGVGSMGSATCYYLASKGLKVLGLEQFDIPHEQGSHAGQSRIIRKAYYEHPDYVPLLERAYQNWQELEAVTNEQVYVKTGLLYFGSPGNAIPAGVQSSAKKFNIPLQELSNAEMQEQYPQCNIPVEFDKLFEPDAGFILPEKAIKLYTSQAIKKGATIITNTKVLGWEKNSGGIEVRTGSGNFQAAKMVVCAGAWAAKLLPELNQPLRITRQVIAWMNPKNPAAFSLGSFPCWTLALKDQPGIFYGFPILPAGRFDGPTGLKLAHHTPGETTDPDHVNRATTKAEEQHLVNCLETYFREAYQSTLVMKTCLYTNTKDENFLLDFLPGYDKSVVIATGFSGHGFKFASAIGEIMSELVINGESSLPIGFLGMRG